MQIKKFKRAMSLLLSAVVSVSVFASRSLTVSATLDELNAAAEARKALPIETNQIENWPAGPAIGAEGAILMEAYTGSILYSKNIHEELYPASTTKLLTCLLAVENADLNDMVTFSHDAVFTVPRDGSNMGIDEGESLSMEECLYGILIGSANEVANAVAEHVAGSMDAFADMMNERARELGCTNSNFVNSNGLFDENHYTSAYDLAVISRAFFQNELLCRISGTPSYHFEPTATQPDDFIVRSKNKLVNAQYPYEGIVGGKTGYTKEARETLVTCAERDGMKLICVIMKEESPAQFTDTMELLDYGFNNFRTMNVAENETKYSLSNSDFFQTDSDIFGSSKPILALDTESRIILPKTADFDDIESQISYDVDRQNQVARILYTYHGAPVGEASINLASDTPAAYDFDTPAVEPPAPPEKEKGENTIFVNVKKVLLAIIITAVSLCLLLIVIGAIRNYQYEKRRRRRRRRRRQQQSRYNLRDYDM